MKEYCIVVDVEGNYRVIRTIDKHNICCSIIAMFDTADLAYDFLALLPLLVGDVL